MFESKMKFMHAIYNNTAKPSFSNVWPKNNNRDQQYDLRNLDNFIIPKPRFEGFKKYPHYSFAKVWNESGDLRLYTNFMYNLQNCIEIPTTVLEQLAMQSYNLD